MWFVKFLFKLGIGITVSIFLFYFIFLSERYESLEDDPAVKQLIGNEFVITKKAYLRKYDDEKKGVYYLEIPKMNTDVCPDTEDFIEYPDKWFYFSNGWNRLVMTGTQFKISKIFKRIKPMVGVFLVIEAVVLNGNYKGYKVRVVDFF